MNNLFGALSPLTHISWRIEKKIQRAHKSSDSLQKRRFAVSTIDCVLTAREGVFFGFLIETRANRLCFLPKLLNQSTGRNSSKDQTIVFLRLAARVPMISIEWTSEFSHRIKPRDTISAFHRRHALVFSIEIIRFYTRYHFRVHCIRFYFSSVPLFFFSLRTCTSTRARQTRWMGRKKKGI